MGNRISLSCNREDRYARAETCHDCGEDCLDRTDKVICIRCDIALHVQCTDRIIGDKKYCQCPNCHKVGTLGIPDDVCAKHSQARIEREQEKNAQIAAAEDAAEAKLIEDEDAYWVKRNEDEATFKVVLDGAATAFKQADTEDKDTLLREAEALISIVDESDFAMSYASNDDDYAAAKECLGADTDTDYMELMTKTLTQPQLVTLTKNILLQAQESPTDKTVAAQAFMDAVEAADLYAFFNSPSSKYGDAKACVTAIAATTECAGYPDASTKSCIGCAGNMAIAMTCYA